MIVSTASWENRRLCDDGACTGLIGGDGVCSVCGRPVKFWGDERRRGMQDDDESDASEDGDGVTARGADANGADDDDRALCPDGSCTGLLDRDGRCKVCGKVDTDAIKRVRSMIARARDDRANVAAGAEDGGDDGDGADGDAAGDASSDDDRALCPDGACTGLLGSDGACKLCGRRAEA